MERYVYSPLWGSQIRILELLPAESDGTLRASLTVHDLDDRPQYEALSYCWGEFSNMIPMLLNEADTNVTSNLAAALRALRSPEVPRLIWVDALCINQADCDEKSRQVQLMSRIYGAAAEVIIWLGEASAEDETVIPAFKKHRRSNPTRNLARQSELLLPQVDALNNLLSRPYFHRLWVVQEVAFATRAVVHCGGDSIDWTEFSDTVIETWRSHRAEHGEQASRLRLPLTVQSAIFKPLDHAQAPTSGCTLLELASAIDDAALQCSDERDKIFAILALTHDNSSAWPVRPDYNLSVKELYCRVGDYFIRSTGTLDSIVRPWAAAHQHLD